MRVDPNFKVFAGHPDWYTYDEEIGYVPTDKAPEEAVRAMKKLNSYTHNKEKKTEKKR